MPLQAPGTEGSIGFPYALPACNETRANDETRAEAATRRDQKKRTPHRPVYFFFSLHQGRGETRLTPPHTSFAREIHLSMIGRGACRGVSIPHPPKRLCCSWSSLCALWPTYGNLARTPRIGRERRQVLVNSAHVRADTHACNGAGGGWWKEAKAGVVVRKLLL